MLRPPKGFAALPKYAMFVKVAVRPASVPQLYGVNSDSEVVRNPYSM